MKRIILTCLLFLVTKRVIFAQVDNVGSGRALKFDGSSDYVVLGDVYHNVNFPFTIMAWVNLDASSGASPVMATNDNNPVYRGFWFITTPTVLMVEFGDGTGGNNPIYRQGKISTVPNIANRWVHACAVVQSPSLINLYLNGIDVGGGPSGGSSLSMASSFAGDTPKIGYFLSNGVQYHFKGSMDEVRLYNRALTQDEVRLGMCKKLTGNETGLIGYWSFDETSGTTVFDKSKNGFNGTLQGNPQRVYSGAPIGDDSKYAYTFNWSGQSLSFQDQSNIVKAYNVTGNPEGLHLYEIKSLPSQSGNLDLTKTSPPYFGAFIASLDADNKFDIRYDFQNTGACSLATRTDNSVPSWSSSGNPAVQVSQRTELIGLGGQKVSFDLGNDQILCNKSSLTLTTGLTDPSLGFLWSTGATSSSINVSSSGKYKVSVSTNCGIVRDSVTLMFISSPSKFSLGPDQQLCKSQTVSLYPKIDTANYSFLWQDGTKYAKYQIKAAGSYWVTVKNYCGQQSDTINFAMYPIPKLGNDTIICNQSAYTIQNKTSGKIVWSTGDTTQLINVNKSGVYWVQSRSCPQYKDTIALAFVSSPKPIDLGVDRRVCQFVPFVVKPVNDSTQYSFKWQDGSANASYRIHDFGTYWVTVKNYCGQVSDTLHLVRNDKLDFSKLPNVITPNNDGKNEVYMIPESFIGELNLEVFNRWGDKVYQSHGYSNDWNGEGLDSGVYYLLITGACIQKFRTPITILR
ncbi:MAG: gliding motility-associated C-terminal domain-containing protein [Bacteroidetes bacterium]|nr:gliding motility-associated C-terminal domain-containing protein [Bacteroidota bacterium]